MARDAGACGAACRSRSPPCARIPAPPRWPTGSAASCGHRHRRDARGADARAVSRCATAAGARAAERGRPSPPSATPGGTRLPAAVRRPAGVARAGRRGLPGRRGRRPARRRRPGARHRRRPGRPCAVRSAAASLVLPGAGGPSRLTVRARVGGGRPARLRARSRRSPRPAATTARSPRSRLDEGAKLLWREEIVLGRHGERPGRYLSRFDAHGRRLPAAPPRAAAGRRCLEHGRARRRQGGRHRAARRGRHAASRTPARAWPSCRSPVRASW